MNSIDKVDFLEAYPSARIKVFKPETIKNSVAATGLIPYNPSRVPSKLNIRVYTPITPLELGKRVVAENALELRRIIKASFLD
jgi:hypothetical protein